MMAFHKNPLYQGAPIFRGYVSFREGTYFPRLQTEQIDHFFRWFFLGPPGQVDISMQAPSKRLKFPKGVGNPAMLIIIPVNGQMAMV